MNPIYRKIISGFCLIILILNGCSPLSRQAVTLDANRVGEAKLKVLVVESFLADMAQNVAGDRLEIATLIPLGLDPHNYEPAPQDIVRLTESDLVIVNGAGFESWLDKTLNAVSLRPDQIVAASNGLTPRIVEGQIDPHFWLDPSLAVTYIENIRAAFIRMDPEGAAEYNRNANLYEFTLRDLDNWIRSEVEKIPPENRLMVTNHESFGYFIEHYGFRSAGSILPSPSSEASPSARQMTELVDIIRKEGVKAVFVETGANSRLADQLASESGITVVTDLYTHSLSSVDGPAPTYIDLMKYDTKRIVEVLK